MSSNEVQAQHGTSLYASNGPVFPLPMAAAHGLGKEHFACLQFLTFGKSSLARHESNWTIVHHQLHWHMSSYFLGSLSKGLVVSYVLPMWHIEKGRESSCALEVSLCPLDFLEPSSCVSHVLHKESLREEVQFNGPTLIRDWCVWFFCSLSNSAQAESILLKLYH